MKVKFLGVECDVVFRRYNETGGVAIELVCPFNEEQGYAEPMAMATVNIGLLGVGEVAIKNYSENEGMLKALIEAGVVHSPHRFVQSGFVGIPICYLTEATHEATAAAGWEPRS